MIHRVSAFVDGKLQESEGMLVRARYGSPNVLNMPS